MLTSCYIVHFKLLTLQNTLRQPEHTFLAGQGGGGGHMFYIGLYMRGVPKIMSLASVVI